MPLLKLFQINPKNSSLIYISIQCEDAIKIKKQEQRFQMSLFTNVVLSDPSPSTLCVVRDVCEWARVRLANVSAHHTAFDVLCTRDFLARKVLRNTAGALESEQSQQQQNSCHWLQATTPHRNNGHCHCLHQRLRFFAQIYLIFCREGGPHAVKQGRRKSLW